jgi:hypothetical protein
MSGYMPAEDEIYVTTMQDLQCQEQFFHGKIHMGAEAAFSKDKHFVTSSPYPKEDGTSTRIITNYVQKTNSLTRLCD